MGFIKPINYKEVQSFFYKLYLNVQLEIYYYYSESS